MAPTCGSNVFRLMQVYMDRSRDCHCTCSLTSISCGCSWSRLGSLKALTNAELNLISKGRISLGIQGWIPFLSRLRIWALATRSLRLLLDLDQPTWFVRSSVQIGLWKSPWNKLELICLWWFYHTSHVACWLLIVTHNFKDIISSKSGFVKHNSSWSKSDWLVLIALASKLDFM